MKEYYPDKRCLWTIKLMIIPIYLAIWFLSGRFIPAALIVDIVRCTAAAICILLGYIYYPLFVRTLKYTVTDTEIKRSGGVFIRTFQSVRYSSVQYITTARCSFSHYTGLNFILFFVYGGQMRLLFLSREDSDEIMQTAFLRQREE